jgi:hypothetical protein
MAAVMLATMPGTQAHADPTPTDVEAQITVVWNKLEPLIEQYNGVHEQYQKNKAQQDDLLAKLSPLQKQLDLGQIRVGAMAAEAYMGGQMDYVNAIATSGSPKVLAEQLSILDQLSFNESSQLSGVLTLKQQYDAQKKPIDDLVAQLAAQDAELAAQRSCRTFRHCGSRRTGPPAPPGRTGRGPARRRTHRRRATRPRSSPAPKRVSRTCGPLPVPTRTTAPDW